MSTAWTENVEINSFICDTMACSHVEAGERIQSLWSGYGEIRRLLLRNELQQPGAIDSNYGVGARTQTPASLIAKWIDPPATVRHPRGWGTPISHRRKLESYRVEANWYKHYSHQCPAVCALPSSPGQWQQGEKQLLLLSDLDTRFPQRHQSLDATGVRSCLRWLAEFHAFFYAQTPTGLWQEGTYWHLATRPDEFKAMATSEVRDAARWLADQLSSCPYQTLVHGDAKVANFCFTATRASSDNSSLNVVASSEVAAVDFQYVGGGVGIRDVVYFLGSCLTESELQKLDSEYLEFYFDVLAAALSKHHPQAPVDKICAAWQALYAVAWTDFYRFLLGWMPDHPKTHAYTQRLAEEALKNYKS